MKSISTKCSFFGLTPRTVTYGFCALVLPPLSRRVRGSDMKQAVNPRGSHRILQRGVARAYRKGWLWLSGRSRNGHLSCTAHSSCWPPNLQIAIEMSAITTPSSETVSSGCYDSSMRRVSRRPEGENTLRDAAILQRTMNRLRGTGLIPRGVYRFRDHEEANEWMIRTIAATHAHLSSMTSSRSARR